MGCDIHLLVEKQLAPDWWVTVDTMGYHKSAASRNDDGTASFSWPIAETRNYHRFAALAGVRGDGPPPRGFPDNLSETAHYMIDMWAGDGHSHSWLPLKEAAAIFLRTEDLEKDKERASGDPSYFYFNVKDGGEEDLDKYRVVFWFDN